MDKQRINCWEVGRCGREPGGDKSAELGVCPVFEAAEYDSINDGRCGGRFCWAIAGTLCHGQVQGTFAQKAMDCMQCEFYALVVREQGVRSVIVNPSQIK